MTFCLMDEFLTHDDSKQPYTIELEKNDNYTHHHGKVTEEGYLINCTGAKHFIKAPSLQNFSVNMGVLYKNPIHDVGEWELIFRYNKLTRIGLGLNVAYTTGIEF